LRFSKEQLDLGKQSRQILVGNAPHGGVIDCVVTVDDSIPETDDLG